jgi:integrase
MPPDAFRLIEACSAHFRPILCLSLMTTCHPSEAIFLDWRQVDLTTRRVQFPRGRARNGRSVSLHPAIVAVLARLPYREGAVFRRPDGRPYRRERGAAAVKTAFTAACRRAKVKDFTIRDVRVTSAVWQLARNPDFDAHMRRGGWRGDLRMAARYKRISTADLDALRAALNKMEL